MVMDNSIRMYCGMRNADRCSALPVPEYTCVKNTYTHNISDIREREKEKLQCTDHDSPE
jgi:hypothetical protein